MALKKFRVYATCWIAGQPTITNTSTEIAETGEEAIKFVNEHLDKIPASVYFHAVSYEEVVTNPSFGPPTEEQKEHGTKK